MQTQLGTLFIQRMPGNETRSRKGNNLVSNISSKLVRKKKLLRRLEKLSLKEL